MANLIIHKLQEPSSSSPQERKETNVENVQKILKVMNCENINLEEDRKSCVRIEEKSKNQAKIRPLLIGFSDHKSRFLSNSSYNHKNIIPDLTARQRKEEDMMRKEAEKINAELNQNEAFN